MRVGIAISAQSHAIQKFIGAFSVLGPVAVQPESDVVGHRQVRKQREILKHQPDRTGLGRHEGGATANQLAVNVKFATVLAVHTRENAQGGGFAAPRRPSRQVT